MDTMLIEITNQKAAGLLNELAELNFIKIFHRENREPAKTKLSEKYRGFLTREEGQELNNHIAQVRNEWNSIQWKDKIVIYRYERRLFSRL